MSHTSEPTGIIGEDTAGSESYVKPAAQRLRPIRPPALIRPRQRQIKLRAASSPSQPRPASASLGHPRLISKSVRWLTFST